MRSDQNSPPNAQAQGANADDAPQASEAESVDGQTQESGFPPSDEIVLEAAEAEFQCAIDQLNSEHFVSTEGGNTYVFKEAFDYELKLERLEKMSFEAFRQLWATTNVRVLNGHDDDGKPHLVSKPLANVWLNSPHRRTFKHGMALLPDASDIPYGVYNLWRGWGCKPQVGATVWQVRPALRHIFAVVCAKNKRAFRYLLRWLAWAIQNHDLQAEVAIVLIGGRGTGKGTLGRWVRDLFGAHGIHITHPRHLTGNFNAHLRSTLFAFVDEAFFAGDKASNSVLKALITEDQVAIEKKGIDTIPIRNRLKILMATNDAHAVLAGDDERRYLVLEVSDCYKQNRPYFRRLNAWWNAGGKEALLGFLMTFDLGGYEIRDIPNTTALESQKTESLDPVDKWLLGVLAEGRWSFEREWQSNVSRRQVIQSLEDYARAHNLRYVNSSPVSVGKRLRKHLEVGTAQETIGDRRKTWTFPNLDEARKQFADSLGLQHFDWDAI